MSFTAGISPENWRVEKIAVIGAGIVGIPMAAALARARIRIGTDNAARVVLVQRDSPTSGWKVAAVNSGRSPIGGVEPGLQGIVEEAVSGGALRASHDYGECRDADVILICVQTDKDGFRPDYGPLHAAIDGAAGEIGRGETRRIPLIVIESTLAPTSLATLIRNRFLKSGLVEGRDILIGHSPNRVMPGRLIERIEASDKIIGALGPRTLDLMETLYSRLVTRGRLLRANGLTAEIVKTLENAYRDVRIAFSAEAARYCDSRDIDFYAVRDEVNTALSRRDAASLNPDVVPTGGLLVPTVGVGGHCLPKDGILLLWRKIEARADTSSSLILEARRINDESPAEAVRLMEDRLGELGGKNVAVLGAAYRGDSEDTRNSPSLALAGELAGRGCRVTLHDPYVRPDDQNLRRFGMQGIFQPELGRAVAPAQIIVFATAHHFYLEHAQEIPLLAPRLAGVFDGCNLFRESPAPAGPVRFAGIGKGRKEPEKGLLDSVASSFRAVEAGFANEIRSLLDFLNERYADDEFSRVDFGTVRELAGTCVTGCDIVLPSAISGVPAFEGFSSRLARRGAGRAS
ncbi:MAG: nucleotide sugar dehydrogenase [Candidatus Aminicenantales bacterium]